MSINEFITNFSSSQELNAGSKKKIKKRLAELSAGLSKAISEELSLIITQNKVTAETTLKNIQENLLPKLPSLPNKENHSKELRLLCFMLSKRNPQLNYLADLQGVVGKIPMLNGEIKLSKYLPPQYEETRAKWAGEIWPSKAEWQTISLIAREQDGKRISAARLQLISEEAYQNTTEPNKISAMSYADGTFMRLNSYM